MSPDKCARAGIGERSAPGLVSQPARTWAARAGAILIATAAVGLATGAGWFVDQLNVRMLSVNAQVVDWMIVAALVSYTLAMALPFVPGIEIGIALMLLLGPRGVVLVYLATQVAILSSFLVARLVPLKWLSAAAEWLRCARVCELLDQLARMEPPQRLEFVTARVPGRWTGGLLRHRYLLVCMAINLPGNAVIGGAGGIAVIAGVSGVFELVPFTIVVAVATTPVPLFLLLAGLV